jgi:C1A family cysteine protease
VRIKYRNGMIIVLAIACFMICSCGGGGGGSGTDEPGGGDPPAPNTIEYSTGNQDFDVAKAMEMDPLGDLRAEAGAGASPSRVDHSALMPRVRNQGHTGSCTAWANGYYTKSYQEAREEGWDVNENVFSPGYLFAMQCRTYDDYDYRSPYSLLVSYSVLSEYGCAKWSTMPYEDLGLTANLQREMQAWADLEIPQGANSEARNYRCGGFATAETLGQVKQTLTQGLVVAAINHYETPPAHPSPEENYMRYNAQNDRVGHAITLVGYDDAKFGTGALKFINSWGEGWAENGFSWIRYSDCSKIILSVISYNDLENPNTPDDPPNADKRPDSPSDVDASDDLGNYVDVTWSPVSGAAYYRIYRAEAENHNGYEEIGSAYQGNYRDYPTPGVAYYYAVVAVNDLGESDHYGGDTDSEGYIDIGSAIGGSRLATPTLTWDSNDAEGSSFSVSDIDPAAASMEVQVSKYDTGPWESLGWITPQDFKIKWAEDSQYGNQQPFVRVRVTNDDAASDFCEPVQVGEDIPTDIEVGTLGIVVFDARESSMMLRWMPEGNIDYVEIWRYCASSNTDNNWVKLGYRDSSQPDQDGFINYEDTTPKPGIPYYYAIVPVYRGTYGEVYQTDRPYQVAASAPNLHLVSFQYYYTQISANTAFPNIVVRNDGGTDIPGYSIGVLAKSWADGSVHLVGRETMTETLLAGSQHNFDIYDFAIPEEYADGTVYSWGIMVDYDETIDEVYESDNTLWSTDGWWLAPDSSAAVNNAQLEAVRLGSSRPFGEPLTGSDARHWLSTESVQSIGDDLQMIYNGPATFEKPDFCIRHGGHQAR